MTSPTFVTQATNFLSAISGAVDPRTGLYGVSINLGKFSGNRGLGPSLPLSLRYSPLNQIDFGLSRGFKFDTSAYRRSQSGVPAALLLSTGEQYGVQETSGDVFLRQHPLKSLTFKTQRNQKGEVIGYLIAHKSGALEFLGAGSNICLPYKIYTAAGHWLNFKWVENQDVPKLQWVKDEKGTTLLSATYSTLGATFEILPGNTTEGYRVEFNFQAGSLANLVAKGSDNAKMQWSFDRHSVGDGSWGVWITGMTAPGGYSENAFYPESGGHQWPQGAPYRAPMPYANRFERDPGGGQPKVVSTYSFSARNYLGAASGKNWDSSQDTLMSGPFDASYQYSCIETQVHGQGTNRHDTNIERLYNAYHLQVREKTTCGLVTQLIETDYDIKPNTFLEKQPPYYQMPVKKATTWDNGQGATTIETVKSEWDDWGNPLKRTDPDGAITQWTYYYGAANAPDDPHCPRDPNGFVRFARWMRVDPTKVDSQLKDARIQQTNFRYAGFAPAFQNDQVTTVVLKSYESHLSGGSVDTQSGELAGGTLLSEATFDYFGGDDAGRLKAHSFTHYSNNSNGDTYVTSETFDYPSTVDKVTTNHTLDTYDNLTITDTKTISAFTGRVLSTTDLQQNVTTYTYDCFGRPKTRTLNSASTDGYRNQWTYENYVSQQDQTTNHAGKWPFQIIQSDGNHNRICYTMDGHGNVLFTDVNDRDSSDPARFHTSESRRYDDRGRLLKSTGFDYDLVRNTTYSLEKTLAYDDWGNAATTTYSDQTVETHLHDPARKTTTVTHSGPTTVTGTQVTTLDYNFSKKPVKIERYLAGKTPGVDAPYSTQTKLYDGLHLLRSETEQSDADGSGVSKNFTSSYEYDPWGRLSQTQLPDSTVVLRQYSDTSPEKYVSDIAVSGKSVGDRKFDGLGRVTAKTVSGKPWTYQYAAATDSKPKYENTPDNQQLSYTYNPQLSEALWTVSVADVNQSYQYDPISGVMNGAQSSGTNENSATQFTLYDSGRLKSETITYDGKSAPQPTQFDYTVGGALLSYRHIDNAVSTVSRDSNGRITQVADDSVSVSPLYDSAGRLTGWTASELIGGNPAHTLTTTLQLDDMGRETGRTVKDSATSDVWTTTQEWYANDLLQTRSISKNGGKETKYSYTYDSRNRLTSWSVTRNDENGPSRPYDRYGNEMTGQDFVMDGYGNITLATTTFNTTPKTTNEAAFTYDPTHPCLLVSISNTHASYPPGGKIEYDAAGRITYDGMETRLTYNALGRVSSATSSLTGLKGDYGYDHHNRLYRQTRSDENDPIYFYYKLHDKLDQLVNLIQGDDQQRLFRSLSGAPAAQFNTGSNAGAWLLGADMLGSVTSGSDGATTEERVYTAYGEEAVKPIVKPDIT
ncbi:hypothetical protein AB1286_03670 [Trinickia sp. NRRL B-1857]|uniref:RHS repeat domain-containing protein n=1 Tax=Trinickia sp. NRRL B-1857 TaxID=3162879 RepID=UPI003D2E7419